MSWKLVFFVIFFFLTLIFFPMFILLYYQYVSLAAPTKANIIVDINRTVAPIPDRWKALAQGGEEKGVRMLQNVASPTAALYPKFIRIDHIYDHYDVLSRDPANGKLNFNWSKLDDTVCDIYHAGAKPFFVLGYMPEALSGDNSMVSAPKNWDDWSLLVQKTIERYSGKDTRLCGQISGFWLSDIYYEVWNEPDVDTFGNWTISAGNKDYRTLYFYTSLGALKTQNVNNFNLGGPSVSYLNENWIKKFLDSVNNNGAKLDFLSWHHYDSKTTDFPIQISNLNAWLSDDKYKRFLSLPKIISEWGYDTAENPIAETNIGAAHTVASIRNFFQENIAAAFLFEIKDGPNRNWGILSYDGKEKPRYNALKLLNILQGQELFVEGEGTYVTAMASKSSNKIALILVNYDPQNLYSQAVPVTFNNLIPGIYSITTNYIDRPPFTSQRLNVPGTQLQKTVYLPSNTVVGLELVRETP